MTPIIDITHLSKSYMGERSKPIDIFNDFSITFFDKDITAVLGPTGSGKTTLLNLINGLLLPEFGAIRFPSESSSLRIGTVLQRDLLLPWRNVRQNALLGLEVVGESLEKYNLQEKLKEFGLDEVENLYPDELSGGMRQKVSLIRTLLFKPDLILLDEPFASIDYYRKLELESYCTRWIKNNGRTAILVTHDIEEAIAISDRAIVFRGRPVEVVLDVRIELQKDATQNPILARKQPGFAEYFAQIWNALSSDES